MRFVYQTGICVWLILTFTAVINSNGANTSEQTADQNKTKHSELSNKSTKNVLLISFDGFRWDYFDRVDTPVLNSFKTLGVHAKYVKNVFPTETFPNHVSLATGLYPESHGFLSNEMYDPILKSVFKMNVTDPKWWWGSKVEPIWYTNENQGGVSGVCYWPGFNIDGYKPTFYPDKEQKYSIPYHQIKNLMPYQERVDYIINWLTQKEKPSPNFLMLYFGQLDEIAHQHGYGSIASLREVSKLDNITGYLIDQLSQHNLLDKWNIIVTGDHGMTNLSLNRVINLTKYLNSSDYRIYGDGAAFFIWPNEGKLQKVFKILKHAHPNMRVYLKDNIPKDLHYRKNRRVSPIMLILDEGWMLNAVQHPFNRNNFVPGGHGYLNTLPSMWPLFRARGPAFKQGYASSTFQSIDIYSLMCEILEIQPRPNNGSFHSVRPLLKEDASTSTFSPIMVAVIVTTLFFAFGILVFTIAMCLSHKKTKRRRAWNTKVVMSELEQSNSLLLNDCDEDSDDGLSETRDG